MNAKQLAGEKAAEWVEDGMTIGLGTGSTVYYTIEKIGEMVKNGLQIVGVPTSERTRIQAEGLGIPLTSLNEVEKIDLTIDGSDEVDASFRGIKGGGGALLREKMVADISDTNIWVVSSNKRVDVLGKFPLPIEVIPFGYKQVANKLQKRGADARLRKTEDGDIYVTDNGNYILDIYNQAFTDPAEWQDWLQKVPGIVEQGFFLGIVDIVIAASESGEIELFEREKS